MFKLRVGFVFCSHWFSFVLLLLNLGEFPGNVQCESSSGWSCREAKFLQYNLLSWWSDFNVVCKIKPLEKGTTNANPVHSKLMETGKERSKRNATSIRMSKWFGSSNQKCWMDPSVYNRLVYWNSWLLVSERWNWNNWFFCTFSLIKSWASYHRTLRTANNKFKCIRKLQINYLCWVVYVFMSCCYLALKFNTVFPWGPRSTLPWATRMQSTTSNVFL